MHKNNHQMTIVTIVFCRSLSRLCVECFRSCYLLSESMVLQILNGQGWYHWPRPWQYFQSFINVIRKANLIEWYLKGSIPHKQNWNCSKPDILGRNGGLWGRWRPHPSKNWGLFSSPPQESLGVFKIKLSFWWRVTLIDKDLSNNLWWSFAFDIMDLRTILE